MIATDCRNKPILQYLSYIAMSKSIIYQGVEYNMAPYLAYHPGGQKLVDQCLQFKKDITEFFKSTHSKQAERKLLGLEQVGQAQRTKFQRLYCRIQELVRRFYSPSYFIEITLTIMICAVYVVSHFVSQPIPMIATFSASQIVGAWSAHSQLHQRNSLVLKMGKFVGLNILGLSEAWWRQKHYQHHFFTNHDKLDPDIEKNYTVFVYPLLLFKWRLDSLIYSIKNLQMTHLLFLFVHYTLCLKLKLFPFFLSLLISGLFIAVVVVGNHERELRYRQGAQKNDFLIDQLQTTRNYDQTGFLWNFVLGGFNFHTQHHLFPQVPFYNLESVHRLLMEQLEPHRQKVKTGDLLISYD